MLKLPFLPERFSLSPLSVDSGTLSREVETHAATLVSHPSSKDYSCNQQNEREITREN